MKTKQKILSLIGTIFLLIMGYFLFEHLKYVSTENAQVEAHSVMLAPKVSGYVMEVHADEGTKVKKGELLVQLDQRDYQNTLDQIKGDLNSYQARMLEAQKNFERNSSLFSSGAVSRQQYDTSATAFSEAIAKFTAFTAQLAQAQLNLDNTKILAPTDGIISRSSVEVGQLASPGVPLIGFVSLDERWITANFKETDIKDIVAGAEADIEIDALGSQIFHGKVKNIGPATGATFALLPPDNATGNFTKVVQRVPVTIALDGLNPDQIEFLRAGLSAFVKVHRK